MTGSRAIAHDRIVFSAPFAEQPRASLELHASPSLQRAMDTFHKSATTPVDFDMNKPVSIYRGSKEVFLREAAKKRGRPLNLFEKLSNELRFVAKTRVHYRRLSQTGVGAQIIAHTTDGGSRTSSWQTEASSRRESFKT